MYLEFAMLQGLVAHDLHMRQQQEQKNRIQTQFGKINIITVPGMRQDQAWMIAGPNPENCVLVKNLGSEE